MGMNCEEGARVKTDDMTPAVTPGPFVRALAVLVTLAIAAPAAGPSRFGFSDRVERHMFPEVTSGPAEPTWSPDGQWIAFSMQGDIWKIPAAGGEAIALTKGPWYYFEPEWSPDGRSIAFTVDTGGNLDIGVVSADGGAVDRLTTESAVDLEPAWARDSRALYFVSSRNRGFDIFRFDIASRAVTPLATGGGDQIQPAVSPDGRTLAYVSGVSGRLGTGGIWTRPLDSADSAQPVLVHYEESEYRMRPKWTPDGAAFLFGSDERGSNDIALVPARGGNPATLTADEMGEFSAAPSPDGKSFAFISNRTGPMTLQVAPIGGGPASSWRAIRIASRRALTPTGRVRVRILGPDGRVMPARVQLIASDGRSYAPDDGFPRVMAVTETHYFHTLGEFAVTVPGGELRIDALRGFEFTPARVSITAKANADAEATLTLRRLADAPASGWHSGDTHAHDLHQGRFGLTQRTLFEQSLAEDLHVTFPLIHMDGTRLMGRWADLTGEPHPVSTRTHILQFGEEFRGSLGHIGMLGISRYILPLIGGVGNTPYAQTASDLPYLDGARAQGGIAGFMHPYLNRSATPAGWAGSLIPVDVALGRGDFYDVASLYSDEMASAEMYYKLLNCGFRVPATGGTDNFPDVWRDPPPGTDRTYARVEGPLSVASWLAAVKAGRTFGTNGPLAFMTVNGREPGSEIKTTGDTVTLRVDVHSIAPLTHVGIIVNGQVVERIDWKPGATAMRIDRAAIAMPQGGWIAVMARGEASTYLGDSYAFAHTSPVYVVRNGTPFVSREDAAFLVQVVEAIRARASKSSWRSDADREAFLREINEARTVYERLANQ